MFRRTIIALAIILLVAGIMFSGCNSADQKDQQDPGQNSRDQLIGNWLREYTVYHYVGKEDRIETPVDSMWFAFDENGVCVFTQRIQGAYHKQLYSWSVNDSGSTLALTSDIQVNTGEFQFAVSDSELTYTRQLETMSLDSLTGWTYIYQRIED